MSNASPTYVVIGGGIAGASIAYHLANRSTANVIVLEQGDIGAETTAKSMAMFGLYGDAVQYRMKRYGLRLYNEFFADPCTDLAYDFAGRLRLATTEAGAEDLRTAVTRTRSQPKPRDLVEYVDGEDLQEVLLLPNVNTDTVIGAAFRPRVGFMSPAQLATEFAVRAGEHGADLRTGVRVTDFITEGDRVTGVVTTDGPIAADTVISAAGPWNIQLAEAAGADLPLRHTLAPVCKFEADERVDYSLPSITYHESPYAIHRQRARDRGATFVSAHPKLDTPTLDAFLAVYNTYDPDALSETVPDEFREGMVGTVEQFLPTLHAEIVDEWVGVRSMTPDGNPIVGWTDVPGFSIAAFNTSGIQLSPAVGDVIARQLLDGESTELYEGLSVSRFEGYTDVHEGEPPAG